MLDCNWPRTTTNKQMFIIASLVVFYIQGLGYDV